MNAETEAPSRRRGSRGRVPRGLEAEQWSPRQRDITTVIVGFEQLFGIAPSLLKVSTWLNAAPVEIVLAALERVSTRIRNGRDYFPEHEVWKLVRRFSLDS